MKMMLRNLILSILAVFLCGCGLVVEEWPTDQPTAPKATAAPGKLSATATLTQKPSTTHTPAPTTTQATLATATTAYTNPQAAPELAGEQARARLAKRLNLGLEAVNVVQVAGQEWPDDCLGLPPEAGKECARGVVDGWQVIVQAAGQFFEYRATGDGQRVAYSGPSGYGAPPECNRPRASAFFSAENHFCFAYPVRFHRADEPNLVIGPSYGKGPEPLFTSLAVEVSRLADGQTLEMAVEAFLAQFSASTNQPAIGRKDLPVGGQPAIQLEVVPGRLGSRDMFVAYQGRLYHLSFAPAPGVIGETAKDVEELFQMVVESFTWVK